MTRARASFSTTSSPVRTLFDRGDRGLPIATEGPRGRRRRVPVRFERRVACVWCVRVRACCFARACSGLYMWRVIKRADSELKMRLNLQRKNGQTMETSAACLTDALVAWHYSSTARKEAAAKLPLALREQSYGFALVGSRSCRARLQGDCSPVQVVRRIAEVLLQRQRARVRGRCRSASWAF